MFEWFKKLFRRQSIAEPGRMYRPEDIVNKRFVPRKMEFGSLHDRGHRSNADMVHRAYGPSMPPPPPVRRMTVKSVPSSQTVTRTPSHDFVTGLIVGGLLSGSSSSGSGNSGVGSCTPDLSPDFTGGGGDMGGGGASSDF